MKDARGIEHVWYADNEPAVRYQNGFLITIWMVMWKVLATPRFLNSLTQTIFAYDKVAKLVDWKISEHDDHRETKVVSVRFWIQGEIQDEQGLLERFKRHLRYSFEEGVTRRIEAYDNFGHMVISKNRYAAFWVEAGSYLNIAIAGEGLFQFHLTPKDLEEIADAAMLGSATYRSEDFSLIVRSHRDPISMISNDSTNQLTFSLPGRLLSSITFEVNHREAGMLAALASKYKEYGAAGVRYPEKSLESNHTADRTEHRPQIPCP